MIKNTITIVALMLTAYYAFALGQDTPKSKPLPDTATIMCPFGSEYILSRGSDATLTVKCVTE